MSIVVNVNGESINYPQTGDTNWGDEATDFAVQTSSAFAKVGLSTGTTVDLPGTLDVTGNTTLDANLSVGGNASVTGNTTLTGNLTVNGNTQLGNANTDTIGVTGNVAISGNETVGGTLGVTGDVAINTNKFNITASSGNTTIAGTLGISNGTALAPAITPSGDTNTGLYSIGADKIGFSANGARVGEFGVGYGGFTDNIIQSVFAQTNTQKTNSTGTPVNVGMPATITPKYINSKIIILYFVSGCYVPTAFNGMQIRLYKNGSNITGTFEDIHCYGGNGDIGAKYSGMFYDTPNTTSPIIYEPYFNARDGVNTIYVQYNNSYSNIILLEVQQ